MKEEGVNRESRDLILSKMREFFWGASFSERYDRGVNSETGRDATRIIKL